MNYKSKPRERNYARLDQYLIDHDLYADKVDDDVTTVQDTVTGAEVTITRQAVTLYKHLSHIYTLSVDGLTVTAHKYLDAVWMAALALLGAREDKG